MQRIPTNKKLRMLQVKSNNPFNNKYLADNWRNILCVKNFDTLTH